MGTSARLDEHKRTAITCYIAYAMGTSARLEQRHRTATTYFLCYFATTRVRHVLPALGVWLDCEASLFLLLKGDQPLMMQLGLNVGEPTPAPLSLENFEYPAIIGQLTMSLYKYVMLPQNILCSLKIRPVRSIRCYVALYGRIPHTLKKSHDRTMTHISRISTRCIKKLTSLWLAGLMFKYTKWPKACTATTESGKPVPKPRTTRG
jgi:hypothetical protein